MRVHAPSLYRLMRTLVAARISLAAGGALEEAERQVSTPLDAWMAKHGPHQA
jgi:hypothetical protein